MHELEGSKDSHHPAFEAQEATPRIDQPFYHKTEKPSESNRK